MNNINMLNVPAASRIFCLINYTAFGESVDSEGKHHYIDLPLLQPIFALSLEEAKTELAKRINVDAKLLGEWDTVGDEDGFCPSICTGYSVGPFVAGYSFDVYTTVNTLHLA